MILKVFYRKQFITLIIQMILLSFHLVINKARKFKKRFFLCELELFDDVASNAQYREDVIILKSSKISFSLHEQFERLAICYAEN